jgi:hypothetical protein
VRPQGRLPEQPAPVDHDRLVRELRHLGEQLARHEHGFALGGEAPQEVAEPAGPCRSRRLAGSSKIRIRGSPSIAAPSPSRWRMPSEYVPARRAAASRPTSSRTSSTRCAGIPDADARTRRWFLPLRSGFEALDLEHCADGPSGFGQAPLRHLEHGRLAIAWSCQPEDHPEGRALPAPLGPRKPVTTPGCTSRLRSSTARTGPDRFGQAPHRESPAIRAASARPTAGPSGC